MQAAADLFDLGNALLSSGDAGSAVEAFRRCLEQAPGHAGASFNLGNALVAAGRKVDAVDAYLACLRARPDFGPAFLNLATALRGLALLDHARAMATEAVARLPGEPEALLCLAGILHDQADYGTAVALYRQALRSAPAHAGALSSLANSLRALGQIADALAAHDAAVAIAPGDASYRFNRATALLEVGDFARGWIDHEWRWQRAGAQGRGFGPAWRGEDIAGRCILLHAEQGLGDTLQFVRYAPLVAARGARVVLEVQPPLVRLLRCLPGIAEVIARGDKLPAFEAHCPLMSLPLAFDTRLETVPAAVPYLFAKPAAPASGGRVGLVWAGSPHMDNAAAHLVDRLRSVSLSLLEPLGDIPGVRLLSLQKDEAAEVPWIEPMPAVADFAETAAIVAGLDLVISVDTAVAHLAGAMGRPVWLLLRYNACWRWLRDRDGSPWYPTMRIYRQERPLDWGGVISRVRADLVSWASARTDPKVIAAR